MIQAIAWPNVILSNHLHRLKDDGGSERKEQPESKNYLVGKLYTCLQIVRREHQKLAQCCTLETFVEHRLSFNS